MSDVLASSCCGRPIFRRRIPFSYRLRDATAFAKAFFASDGCNRLAADSDGDRTAHYAPLRLHGAPLGAPEPPPETMATVPGDVLSSWHGTGVGEVAGWSGAWLGPQKPVFAHFVGGDVSGTKVVLMQALGMWHFEADEVVAHVRRTQRLPPNDTAVTGALPPQLLQDHCGIADAHLCWATWALRQNGEGAVAPGGGAGAGPSRAVHAADDVSWLRLLELSGVGATPVLPTGAAFLRHDLRARARLATLGALLRRVAVRPRAHCDSPWAVMHKKGFRAVWQTPGERWPFAGVGIAIGRCGGGGGALPDPDGDQAEGGDEVAAGGGEAAAGGGEESFGPDAPVPAPSGAPPDEVGGPFCCTPIYGRHINRRQANCIGTVHASLAERQAALLASSRNTPPSAPPIGIATLALSELPRTADGAAIDAARALALLSSPPFADALIVRIRLDAGEVLPPISPLPPDAARRAASLFDGVCVSHAALAMAAPTAAELNASAVAFAHDLRQVGARLMRKLARGLKLGHIVRGREEFGLGNASADAWRHYRAWQEQPKLSKVY